jgi:hypothetical protein
MAMAGLNFAYVAGEGDDHVEVRWMCATLHAGTAQAHVELARALVEAASDDAAAAGVEEKLAKLLARGEPLGTHAGAPIDEAAEVQLLRELLDLITDNRKVRRQLAQLFAAARWLPPQSPQPGPPRPWHDLEPDLFPFLVGPAGPTPQFYPAHAQQQALAGQISAALQAGGEAGAGQLWDLWSALGGALGEVALREAGLRRESLRRDTTLWELPQAREHARWFVDQAGRQALGRAGRLLAAYRETLRGRYGDQTPAQREATAEAVQAARVLARLRAATDAAAAQPGGQATPAYQQAQQAAAAILRRHPALYAVVERIQGQRPGASRSRALGIFLASPVNTQSQLLTEAAAQVRADLRKAGKALRTGAHVHPLDLPAATAAARDLIPPEDQLLGLVAAALTGMGDPDRARAAIRACPGVRPELAPLLEAAILHGRPPEPPDSQQAYQQAVANLARIEAALAGGGVPGQPPQQPQPPQQELTRDQFDRVNQLLSDRDQARQQVAAAINTAQAGGNTARAAAQQLQQAWDTLAAELDNLNALAVNDFLPNLRDARRHHAQLYHRILTAYQQLTTAHTAAQTAG